MIWVFSILYAVFDAYFQISLKKNLKIKDYQIFHLFNAINKVLISFAIGYFAVFRLITAWQDIFYISFIILSIYWIVFDLIYNLLNNQKWYHSGGGMIDKIFGDFQFLIKILFLFINFVLFLQYGNFK